MIEILRWLGILIRAAVRERRDLALENLALRQQLGVLKRRRGVPRVKPSPNRFLGPRSVTRTRFLPCRGRPPFRPLSRVVTDSRALLPLPRHAGQNETSSTPCFGRFTITQHARRTRAVWCYQLLLATECKPENARSEPQRLLTRAVCNTSVNLGKPAPASIFVEIRHKN